MEFSHLQLRLQNLERLNLDQLQSQAVRAKSLKLRRAANHVIKLAEALESREKRGD